MTTDRPYRKALGVDIVMSELLKHKGTQFDPSLVDLVLGSVTIRRAISVAAVTVQSSSIPKDMVKQLYG